MFEYKLTEEKNNMKIYHFENYTIFKKIGIL